MTSTFLRIPLLCLGLMALAACGKGKDQAAPQMPAAEVGVIRAQPENSPLTRDLVGRLSAYRSADVRARVAGVLLKRSYEEGTDVKKGQVLFEIDPAPLKAALDASLAALAQAQATYTNNKVAAQRAHELAPKGYVSRSDLDNADAAERTAAATVQVARANVQTARINLGYAHVTAPIDGRAGQQQVTEGALVGSGTDTLLTTVEQIDPLYVNFTMSVDALEQMRRAQSRGSVTLAQPDQTRVQITLPDGSTYAEKGVLDFSAATVDPATGSVDLRATVANPKHSLLPGMYVTLKASLGQQNKVFLIPQAALQRDTDGAYLMVVGADGKVVRKNVGTGDMVGGNWVITEGLAAGDQVIVSGLQKVKVGALAKASPWQPDAGNSSAAPGIAPAGK
ncbi:MAG: efflux RND transporter periplasmic adaptor subunit [Xanthomonadaceae bacterium]|nr:efflux RND transporter periplasmic adaptor subunit [Xanthomonadaceae bacterium]MDE2249041.1 efflux RND transporter periplasmic adaptor subunit [Xanthomonadaceae bacterium]